MNNSRRKMNTVIYKALNIGALIGVYAGISFVRDNRARYVLNFNYNLIT